MSARRHYLMSIVDLEKYRDAVFSYVYHSLIPSTLNPSGIPSEYQEVEYIESSGTQYIELNIFNYQNQIEVDFIKVAFGNSNSALFGYYYSPSDAYALYTNTYGIYAGTNEKIGTYTDGFTIGEKYSYKVLNDGIYLNGTKIFNRSTPNNVDRTIHIFARKGNDSPSASAGSYKIFNFKIKSQQNLLLYNFIPCYRKSDSVIGLYDTVNGTFYTNAGTGTFSKGADRIATVKDSGKTKLFEIEGNGEIENQLFDYTSTMTGTNTYNGVTLKNNNDGSYTLTGQTTSTGNSYFDLVNDIPLDNVYLIWGANTPRSNLGGSYGGYNLFCRYTGAGVSFAKQYGSTPIIISPTSTSYPTWRLQIQFGNMGSNPIVYNDTFTPRIVNLSIRFGKGNEPTSVLDPRIREIIAENKIGKIQNTYKCSKVSQIDFINKGRLPVEYQEVEFICNRFSNSTSDRAYIDTGWKPNFAKKFKVETVVMPTQSINGSNRLGILSSYVSDESLTSLSLECSGTNWWRIFEAQNNTNAEYRTIDNAVIPYQKNTLIVVSNGSNSSITANNSRTTNFTQPYNTQSYNTALIFIDQQQRPVFEPFNLYSMKIWEEDVLIRDYVPCYRISDGVAGLYDLVNETFSVNSGTGVFMIGDPIYNNQYTDHLPAGYQEVEYVESTGTQYIDSGLLLSQFDTVQTTFAVTQSKSGVSSSCGVRNANNEAFTYLRYENDVFIPFFAGNSFSTNVTLTPNGKHDVKIITTDNQQKVYVDGDLLSQGSYSIGRTGNYTLWIFALNNNGVISSTVTPARIYNFKISNNGVLVRSFIPCYRKTDSVIGLYDLVEGKFYVNAGTGTFLKGPDVTKNQNYITLPGILELDGAMNAHNLFRIYPDRYEFTRNAWKYTFTGSETWNDILASRYSCNVISSLVKRPLETEIANILCVGMTPAKSSNVENVENGIAIGTNGTIRVHSSSITSTSTAQSYMTGKTLAYELATPQVITIPKKHLGCVDLGNLNWSHAGAQETGYFHVSHSDSKRASSGTTKANLFCSIYMTDSSSNIVNHTTTMTIGKSGANDNILVFNPNYGDATSFKSAMAGQYLWYETDSEVTDFINKARFERGGTINTNEYGWFENQLVSFSAGSASNNGINVVRNNDKITGSFNTDVGGATALTSFTLGGGFNAISTHKYLCYSKLTGQSNSTYEIKFASVSDNNGNGIILSNISGTKYVVLTVHQGYESTQSKEFAIQVIDLTVGFGAGKEPTSIEDPRIKDIIEKGYIATNTTGTYQLVQTQTLCDLDMKVQVK